MAVLPCALRTSAALAAPRAEEHRLAVDTAHCSIVRAEKLRGLLVLELGVERRVPALHLALHCRLGRAELRVINTDSQELATRTIALAPEQPEAERLVAAAASQLVIAVWLERTEPPQATLASPAPRALPNEQGPQDVTEPRGRQVAIELLGGARARNPGTFAIGPFAGVQASYWQGHFAPRLRLTVEQGASELELGSARLSVAEFAAGAAWRSSSSAALSLQLGVFAALCAVRIRGQSSRSDVSAGSVQGVTADMGVDGALVLALGSFRLGATLGAGYLPKSAVGVVSDGTTLSPEGPWGGVGLSLGGVL